MIVSPNVKALATWGLGTAAVVGLATAGGSKLVGEREHHAGQPFSNLAKWEFGLGLVATAVAACAAGAALTYPGDPAFTNVSTKLAAALIAVPVGFVAGRMATEMPGPSLSLANG